jgi:hypothetical protein
MSKKKPKPKPERPRPNKELAAAIAQTLFTSGWGRAKRLVHEQEGKELNGPGWGEGPAADQIEVVLDTWKR